MRFAVRGEALEAELVAVAGVATVAAAGVAAVVSTADAMVMRSSETLRKVRATMESVALVCIQNRCEGLESDSVVV